MKKYDYVIVRKFAVDGFNSFEREIKKYSDLGYRVCSDICIVHTREGNMISVIMEKLNEEE